MICNDDAAKTWRVDICVDEHDERTPAKARLRALNDLANQLLTATEYDIEAATHQPVTELHL